MDLKGLTFKLLRCETCTFQFKDPSLSEEIIAECYSSSDADHWGAMDIAVKRDFDLLCNLLEIHAPNRTILDVGCNNGAFLLALGNTWNRFGVEPSQQAADMASTRSIAILGKTLFDITPSSRQFDVITAIDVLEHLTNPLPFFMRIKELLKPDGIFLVQTGDSAAWPWRLEKSRHWYCSLPEHVSFFCHQTLNYIAEQHGMRSLVHRRIRQRRSNVAQRTIETAKNLGYIFGNRMNGFGLPKLQTAFVHRRAPVWISAKDHILCVIQNS